MGEPVTRRRRRRGIAGFSVMELLVAVAIAGIVAALAVPIYRGYVATAREGALGRQLATLALFQEDARLRTGAYGAGVWDPAAHDDSLADATGWRPETDDGAVFRVTADAASWTVNATDASGHSICRVYPAGTPCG